MRSDVGKLIILRGELLLDDVMADQQMDSLADVLFC